MNQGEGLHTSWQGTDLYQVYPRSFNEVRDHSSEYRGEGSIRGITEKLDYISTIADAVWISPFYPSPMKDSGYDIADYTDVDPRYGTLQDFDRLILEAHERDIKIMVDLVPNHTSDQHPWFQASRNPLHPDHETFKDYYIWRNPASDGGPPNNWGSVFSISQHKKHEAGELDFSYTDSSEPFIPPLSAWEYDEARAQFYLHDFAIEQPNLNWHNEKMKNAMRDVLRFWIDRGVDGFRVDVVDHIGKDPAFEDDTFTPDVTFENPYDQLSRDHSIRYWDELEPNIRLLTSVLAEYAEDRDLRLILEAHVGSDLLLGLDNIDPKHAAAFYFQRMKADWDGPTHKHLLDSYHETLPAGIVPNQVNGNHDFTRVASRLGYSAARAAATINAMLPGMNTIYNGEEGGFTDVEVPAKLRDDELGYRDMCRTPMLWDSTHNAGFSLAAEEQLWLPLDPDYKVKNLELQKGDPKSFLSLYQKLHAIKSGSDVLKFGRYEPLSTDDPNVVAFARSHDGQQVIVASNFSTEASRVCIEGTRHNLGRVILSSNNALEQHDVALASGLQLEGNEALVIVGADKRID